MFLFVFLLLHITLEVNSYHEFVYVLLFDKMDMFSTNVVNNVELYYKTNEFLSGTAYKFNKKGKE